MSEDEGAGFIIRDRRGRAEAEEPAPGAQAAAPTPQSTARTASQPGSPSATEPGPPLSFSSFVFSMGTSALMLMGERLDPQQPSLPVNLTQAKEIIDILSILEEKTRGNLTSDEEAVLRDLLYALQMKYVDVASGKQATTSS